MKKQKIPIWARWVAKDPDGWPRYYSRRPLWIGRWTSAEGKEELAEYPYGPEWNWLDELWNEHFDRVFFWNQNLFWTIASRFSLRRIRRGR